MGVRVMNIEIWKGLKNKFDFEEYRDACSSAKCECLPVFLFAQRAGMLQCASMEYPDMELTEAYMRFINEHQEEVFKQPTRISEPVSSAVRKQGCCGGGRVR